jgi:hypothetical protein
MLPPSVRLAAEALRRHDLRGRGQPGLVDLLARDDLHRQRGLAVDALDRRAGDLDALWRVRGALGLASQRQGGQRQEGGLDGQNASARAQGRGRWRHAADTVRAMESLRRLCEACVAVGWLWVAASLGSMAGMPQDLHPAVAKAQLGVAL